MTWVQVNEDNSRWCRNVIGSTFTPSLDN